MPLEDNSRLKKQLEASLARNDSLEKENMELKQEVARLKAQISSLKAHDNDRKSMLWKKLHNSRPSFDEISFTETMSTWKSSDFVKVSEQNPEPETVCSRQSIQAHDNDRKSMLWKKLHNSRPSFDEISFTETMSTWKSSDFVKVSEQNPEPETVCSRQSFQELDARKDRQSKMSNIPFISLSPKEVKENKSVKAPPVPAPPPPPIPSKLLGGLRAVRRVPEVVELYRSLTRKDANVENNKSNNFTTTPALAFTKNMIGEIENRSTYVSAIKSDVEKQKEFINFLTSEVQSVSFRGISDVEVFVKWLDQELSSLVDERAVLKHFPQWPERKADALREAAFSYRDLKNLETEVSSFEMNPKESFKSEVRRIQTLQDRFEQSVNNIERLRESTSKRYRDFQIPWEWMLDTGLIGQMKFSSLRLAREYMKRTAEELQAKALSQENSHLLQTVRFAYRVHQFAGGFDAETIGAFQDLKKIRSDGDNKQ